jgi:hypothetical protein
MCWFNLYVDFIALQTLLRWALVANERQIGNAKKTGARLRLVPVTFL